MSSTRAIWPLMVSCAFVLWAPGSLWAQDCNENGVPDETELAEGTSNDCNGNGVPDECDVAPMFGLASPMDLLVFEGPTGVAFADFDGDMDTDLAVSILLADAVITLDNDGSGALQITNLLVVDGFPTAIVSGDFNGDNRPDLAVTVTFGVKVFLNEGDAFSDPTEFMAGVEPVNLAAGDLDGDGDLDLVVANSGPEGAGPGSASVLLNEGDGTFALPLDLSAGVAPQSVAIADFDADGALDFAVANLLSDDVSVFFNDGDATFAAPISVPAGAEFSLPTSVTAGDFNNDGEVDLAAANAGPGTVAVLLNQGDRTFGEPMEHMVGTEPFAVVADDLDGDEDVDLAVANFSSDDVSVLLNRGGGDFRPARSHPVSTGPASLATGDLNGDGLPDLAVANLGMLDPEFAPNVLISILLNTTTPGASADINHDGVPDECGPVLVHIMEGVATAFESGAADVFISPRSEDVALSEFTLLATEDLTLDDVGEPTYTGSGDVPAVSEFRVEGGGLHTVILDPPPAPGEWLKLVLNVTGQTSGASAAFEVWLAHHPDDVNQDSVVNIRDATAFGDEFRGRRSRLLVDTNADGIADVRDATAFGENWRGIGPASQPWREHTLPPRPE